MTKLKETTTTENKYTLYVPTKLICRDGTLQNLINSLNSTRGYGTGAWEGITEAVTCVTLIIPKGSAEFTDTILRIRERLHELGEKEVLVTCETVEVFRTEEQSALTPVMLHTYLEKYLPCLKLDGSVLGFFWMRNVNLAEVGEGKASFSTAPLCSGYTIYIKYGGVDVVHIRSNLSYDATKDLGDEIIARINSFAATALAKQ